MKQDKKIIEMKNLGTEAEKDFLAAGISKASQVTKMGAKKAFLKLLDGREKRGKPVDCCNALYLYAIYGAIYDIDWRDIPKSKKKEFKEYTKKLRKEGKI